MTVTIFNDTRIVYSRAFGVADLPSAKPLGTDTEIYGLPGWRWFEPDQTLRIHCDHAAPGVC